MNLEVQVDAARTLWDQRGSRVIRGNVLAIPVDNTLLYVEPIYRPLFPGGLGAGCKRGFRWLSEGHGKQTFRGCSRCDETS
ncbi:uncharacterized protein Dvar_52210 [Desulfosarcina variabilis str. Montpellier]